MNEKVLKCLYDIKFAIEEIESYFTLKQRTFQEYKSDLMLRRAIERNLEIIGEAMKDYGVINQIYFATNESRKDMEFESQAF